MILLLLFFVIFVCDAGYPVPGLPYEKHESKKAHIQHLSVSVLIRDALLSGSH